MSKKSKKSVKPAAPQVKKSVKPSASPAKSATRGKPVKKTVAPAASVSAPPKPVPSSRAAKKPLLSPAITSAAAAAGSAAAESAARSREGIAITAQIDVGFGNALFIRGEGGGLSWETGTPLECAFDDQWTIKLAPVSGPVTFKFLLNDLTWSVGENYTLAPGANTVFTPAF
ncbi:MAG TPA: hypothetical protein PLN52_14095 [Opitutaceae bacterium]|nr:hypothetical protein [Opitutaceae bacterium]